ncbi:MAG TPA: NAD(P)/FAD-dependent oxidoreductase, partial [Gemmatimonadota bacterium]|nr:NAD(P)/FAD-dependent oxidoreductase [Gemmatimonadota bacterium]
MIPEVVVVGGGPAGAATATLLARAGHAVRLYDRARFPREKPCGEFMSPAAVPILEDLGVRERIEAAGARRLPRVRIVAPGGSVDLDFEDGPAGPGWCWSLSRHRLDAILLDAARAAGADVREGVRVDGVLEERGRVAGVRGRDEDGAPVEDRARLVVGAGGRNCPVARALGLQRRSRARRFDVLARWRGRPAADGAACELHVAGDAYLAVAPQEGTAWNANGVVPDATLRRSRDPEAVYDGLLAAHPAVAERLAGGERAGPVVTSDVTPLVCPRASADGALLVGDAALFLDPFTGQGIYLALRSAVLATRVANAALERGRTDRAALALYDTARHEEIEPKRRVSGAIQIILYRPHVLQRVVRAMRRSPGLTSTIVGVTGDTLPARRAWSAAYGARLAVAGLR